MKRKVFWLRVSYWVGAVTDGLAVIPLASQRAGNLLFGRGDFVPRSAEYRYAMWMTAALMLGWTLLLIWADRKPVERKGILLLTIFPVIFGIVTAQIYGVLNGLLAIERIIPLWVHLAALSSLYIFSYFKARNIDV